MTSQLRTEPFTVKEVSERGHSIKSWSGRDFPGEGRQWLRLCASMARCTGSIPGWEAKIPHALWCSQKHFFIKKINKTTGVGYTGHLVKGMKF